jgi:hypothetical protein
VGRSSSTVALPRWVLGLLIGACAVCLVAVAFLLGRVTAPVQPTAATSAEAAGRAAPASGGEETAPHDLPTPAAAPSEISREALPSRAPAPDGGGAAGRGLAPVPSSGGSPDTAAVAAYFARMDAVAVQVKAAHDPEALARSILDQTLSGNMSGFEELIATQRGLQARLAEVLPPPSCREHHQRSVRLIGRAITLLERTRDAMAGKNPSDLERMATEGHAIEEEAKATDALANDIRRAAGLRVVP